MRETSKKYRYDHPYAKERDEYIDANGWDINRDKKRLGEIKNELGEFQIRYKNIKWKRTRSILIIVLGIIFSMAVMLLIDRFEVLHDPINQAILRVMGNRYPSDFAVGFVMAMLGALVTFVGIELTFLTTEKAFEKEQLVYGREIRETLLRFQTLQAVMEDYLSTFSGEEKDLAERIERGEISQEEYQKQSQEMAKEHQEIRRLISFDYENLRIF